MMSLTRWSGDLESGRDFLSTGRSDKDRPGALTTNEPAVGQHGVEEVGAGGAREVVSAFGPVETAACPGSVAGAHGIDVNSYVAEEPDS